MTVEVENILKKLKEKAQTRLNSTVDYIERKRIAKQNEELERINQQFKLEQLANECKAIMASDNFKGFQEFIDTCVKECDLLLDKCSDSNLYDEQVISIVRIASANKKLLIRLKTRPMEVLRAYKDYQKQLGESQVESNA